MSTDWTYREYYDVRTYLLLRVAALVVSWRLEDEGR